MTGEGDCDGANEEEGHEESCGHADDTRIAEVGGIDEVVRVPAHKRAADHGVEEVDQRPDEPDHEAVPGKRFAFATKDKPEEDVKERHGVMEEDIGQLYNALWTPDVSQEKQVGEANHGYVDGGGSLEAGCWPLRGGKCGLREDDGDEKVAEYGEVAEEVDQGQGEAEIVLEAAIDGEIELQADGQPGEEREDGSTGSVSRRWRHVDLYRNCV